MADYKLTNKADADLVDIYEYGIFNFGIEQSSKYILGFQDKFQFIIEHKELGRSAEELSKNLRRVTYNSHVIFYKILVDYILIVRVLRREMDFRRHLY